MVKLNVIPQLAVMDAEIDIIAAEFEPHCALTVSASIVHFDVLYLGYGHFFSDAHGRLNVKEHVSYGGTYKGLQPMGLFSSAKAMLSKHSCPRFIVLGSIEKTLSYEINIWKGHLTQDQVHQLHVKYPSLGTSHPMNGFYDKFFLAKSVLKRTYLSPNVQRIPINVNFEGEPICGILFLPKGTGPFPGVISIHGANGGMEEFRAALIANHGFACFALAYYDYEGLHAKTRADFQMSYVDKAIDWFCKHPAVISGGVSLVGHSLGAEVALLSSFRKPNNVRSTICINTSIIMETDPNFVHSQLKNNKLEINEIWQGQLTKVANRRISIPRPLLCHQSDKPILFLIGDTDLYTVEAAADVIDQLKRSGKKNILKVVVEGQGHMMEPPYTPASITITTSLRNLIPKSNDPYEHLIKNQQQNWGGNPEIHGKGQLDAWNTLIEFLKKHSFNFKSSKL